MKKISKKEIILYCVIGLLIITILLIFLNIASLKKSIDNCYDLVEKNIISNANEKDDYSAKKEYIEGTTIERTTEKRTETPFESLKYSGKGDKIIKDVKIPDGYYLIKLDAEINSDESSSNVFVELFDGTEKLCYISALPTMNNGRKDNDQDTFSGYVENGRIEVETDKNTLWTITIDVV